MGIFTFNFFCNERNKGGGIGGPDADAANAV